MTGPASLPALPEESATATEVVLGVLGACPKAVATAGKVLREFLAREASPPPQVKASNALLHLDPDGVQVQYSREMILELASSPMASLPPAAWVSSAVITSPVSKLPLPSRRWSRALGRR